MAYREVNTNYKENVIMKILDIRSLETNETRTDGRYPLRIGSAVRFYVEPEPGYPMVLEYICDNQGNPKSGYLRTSMVTEIEEHRLMNEVVVTTVNSIYYFKK